MLGLGFVAASCVSPDRVTPQTHSAELTKPVQTIDALPADPRHSAGEEAVEGSAALAYQWPSDAAVAARNWRGLLVGGFEFPIFSTVEELADAATVVVVGRRVGIGPSVQLGGDPDNDEVSSSFSIVIEVLDIVASQAERHGLSAPNVGDRVTVIVHRRPELSKAEAPVLLFLRQPGDDRYYSQADPEDVAAEHRDYYVKTLADWEAFRVGKYDLMTSQSVLVGDFRTTLIAMRNGEYDPLTDDIAGVPIEDIVERIRSAASQ